MGLDMYLNKEIFIGAEYEFRKISGTIELYQDGKPIAIDLKKVSSIQERVAYWRKANAIHQWFVSETQEGEDDCRRSYVTREQLEKLVRLCQEVLADHSKADALLPTQGGFFFGGTDYDEYYFEDLEHTVSMLTEALAAPDNGEFYYQASW